MAEYTKLSPEDTGAYGFTKLLSENVPFSKKPFIPSVFKKMESSDKLELVNFGNKNDTLTSSVNNNNNLLSLSINDNNQDNINRSRKGKMKMLFYNKDNIPLIVLGPDWLGSLIIIIALIILMILWMTMKNMPIREIWLPELLRWTIRLKLRKDMLISMLSLWYILTMISKAGAREWPFLKKRALMS